MKIKPMLKYQIKGMTRNYFIVMGVVLLLIIVSAIVAASTGNMGMLGGMEFTTIIYLLIASINCYGEELKLCIQNGASRRTFYTSTALCVIITAAVAGLGDTILSVIGNLCESTENAFNFASSYEQAFIDDYMNYSSPDLFDYVKGFILRFGGYAAVIGFGKFVGSVYYRLSNVWRIIVTVGAYFMVFVIMPLLDWLYFDYTISGVIADVLVWAESSPYNSTILGVIGAVVFFAASWLFTRHARVDDRK